MRRTRRGWRRTGTRSAWSAAIRATTSTSVTIAVDATAAVVDEVPDRGLLLAHHPLLLRGVDTVAASTPKGALLHRLIRSGRALFTAHTNADAAAPGRVRRAGRRAGADGGRGAGARCRRPATWTSGWCTSPRRMPTRSARRCSPRAPGTSATIRTAVGASPAPGSSCRTRARRPTIGSVGSVEQVTEDRVEVIAPARLRGHVLAAMRAAHPYEEPAFDMLALAPIPTDVGLGRIGTLPKPETLAAFVSRVHDALPGTSWGVRAVGRGRRRRCCGSRCAAARATRCWTLSRPPESTPTSPPICGTTPPTSTGGCRTSR